MLTAKDREQFRKSGITDDLIDWQLEVFNKGELYVKLNRAAVPGDGILILNREDEDKLIRLYENAVNCSKIKFVPASGAASRMFKSLFEYLDHKDDDPEAAIQEFIENLGRFAFYNDLKAVLAKKGKTVEELLSQQDYRTIIQALLLEDGLNYGSLPKGLLKFHSYDKHSRTAFEEHLVEAASYAVLRGAETELHFTVSPEHLDAFKKLLSQVKAEVEERFKIDFKVSFSIQKPSTDTMAVDRANRAFRNPDGSILFRPGGHGALIYNLNELDSDLLFIKNIDNVVPEKHVAVSVRYKKVLAGKLIEIQSKVFTILRELDKPEITIPRLKQIYEFVRTGLSFEPMHVPNFSDTVATAHYLKDILNRPIRICGVVKNLGEPGGGPYWAPNSRGDICLQIIESSQVNSKDPGQKAIFANATHFNPVDLVCCPKDYQGNKFDLTKFADPATCFISRKSKDGKHLKALELPGLWNGAMADWLTLFIEVPIDTFNPVKTVNDLLRKKHQ